MGHGLTSVRACRTSPASSATTRASPFSLQADQNNTLAADPAPQLTGPAGVAGVNFRSLRLDHDSAAMPYDPNIQLPYTQSCRGLAAQAHAATRQSSSATSAAATRTIGIRSTSTSPTSRPTASCTNSGRRKRTCRPTSPPAAAHTFAYMGAGGHRAAANHAGALQRAARLQRRQLRRLHRRELDQRHVPRLPGRAIRTRGDLHRLAPMAWSATRPSGTMPSRPVCR